MVLKDARSGQSIWIESTDIAARVAVVNQHGKYVSSIGSDKSGNGWLRVDDEAGSYAFEMSIDSNGRPYFQMMDTNGVMSEF
ncbi:MAG: hypothetical protein R3E58_07675 [Phycisphaerae bacterium]